MGFPGFTPVCTNLLSVCKSKTDHSSNGAPFNDVIHRTDTTVHVDLRSTTATEDATVGSRDCLRYCCSQELAQSRKALSEISYAKESEAQTGGGGRSCFCPMSGTPPRDCRGGSALGLEVSRARAQVTLGKVEYSVSVFPSAPNPRHSDPR